MHAARRCAVFIIVLVVNRVVVLLLLAHCLRSLAYKGKLFDTLTNKLTDLRIFEVYFAIDLLKHPLHIILFFQRYTGIIIFLIV